jgi:hypothetical protein
LMTDLRSKSVVADLVISDGNHDRFGKARLYYEQLSFDKKRI